MSASAFRPRAPLLVKLGVAMFILSAITYAPASLLAPALSSSGADIQYKEITGRLWRGEVLNIVSSGQYVGDVSYQLRPLALLSGRVAADVKVSGGPAVGAGRLGASLVSRRVRIENASFDFNLGSVRQYSLFGIPYQGRVRGTIETAVVSRGGCVDVAGEVWTDVLNASSQRYLGDGLLLKGPASCDGERLRIDFKGGNREGKTDIVVAINPNLTYQVTVSVNPDRKEVGDDLRLLGFEDNGGMLVYDAVGALKGAGS